MRRIVFTLSFTLLLQLTLKSQGKAPAIVNSVSEILDRISPPKWSKDSLGTQGYRASFFKEFSTASLDDTPPQKILSVLGKADEIRNTQTEIEYRFYLLDSEINRRKPVFELPYITFVFQRKSNRITDIRRDYLCY